MVTAWIFDAWCCGLLCWRSRFLTFICASIEMFNFLSFGSTSCDCAIPAHFWCVVGSLALRAGLVCFCGKSVPTLVFTLLFLLFAIAFPTFSEDVNLFFIVTTYYLWLFSILVLYEWFYWVVVTVAIVGRDNCPSFSIHIVWVHVLNVQLNCHIFHFMCALGLLSFWDVGIN